MADWVPANVHFEAHDVLYRMYIEMGACVLIAIGCST